MTGTTFNQTSNLIIGDDAAELLRLGSVGIVAGFGGNDTIEGVVNGVAPGSTLFGGQGNDFLTSKGIGDEVFGGMGNDVLVNESGRATQYGDDGNDTILGEEDQNTVYGGAGNDSVYVTEDRNVVFGGDGNDTIRGGEGNDIFAGGAGNDYLIASKASGEAPTFLFGNEGNDVLEAGPNSDSLYGGMGNDSVVAGTASNANNMFLSGDKGGDTITYLGSGEGVILDGDRSASLDSAGTDAGADAFIVGNASGGAKGLDVFGGAGNDSLFGTIGALGAEVEVFMGQGNDYFAVRSGGSSSFSGDFGNDFGSIVAAGNDTIQGDPSSIGTDASAGNDTLLVEAPTATSQSVIFGDDSAGGAAGNDSIVTTGAGSMLIFGGGGNDFLKTDGNSGVDTLVGGAGNDTYVFGGGDFIPYDTLGNNTYIGSIGVTPSDIVTVRANDVFTGGATFLVDGEAELIKNLTDGGIIASDEKDLITIGTATQLTSLQGGDDTLNATSIVNGGSVFGGDGNDVITVSGTDAAGEINGGEGNDSIVFSNSEANVTSAVAGSGGDDTLSVVGLYTGSASGGDGEDVFDIESLGAGATLSGGAGGDEIIIPDTGSTAGVATINADAGNDTISVGSTSAGTVQTIAASGGEGNDIIYGRQFGGDVLSGGNGNDTLFGGGFTYDQAAVVAFGTNQTAAGGLAGGDQLNGGGGADVFLVGTGVAALGYADLDDYAKGDAVSTANVVYYDGTSVADGTAQANYGYNGVFAVDTITGFTPGQDKLAININASAFGAAAGSQLKAGTNVDEMTGAFEAGSITYLSNDGATSGLIFENVDSTGTSATIGILADAGVFAGKLKGDGADPFNGTNTGELSDTPKTFTYDTDTGALYYSPAADSVKLLAIFTEKPTLTGNDIIGLDFATGTISVI